MKKLSVLTIFIFITISLTYSQEYGLGGGLIYNFGTNTIGLDARAEIPVEPFGYSLLEGFTVVPQINLFPISGQRRDLYLGSSLHLGVYRIERWMFYGLMNLSYIGWFNHEDSADPDAKFSSVGFDIGGGITTTKCFRPFLETRYQFRWNQPTIRIGLIYSFNCNKRGQVPCSKIPKDPMAF